ncbi:DUF2461 domain-containing protein [Rhizoctonia solani AG-1 IA]|uniref:DUF2461 domain-containing protein n=1 Tax=Thanatephorus cucumeris (strain AG1-IA) TaxID=983506 RepID=L8X2M5_THACA|nr:DUF2461 domain-containing protein [Rhizoctonia solani AG-1 IA]
MSLLSIIDAVDNFKPTALSTHKFVPFYLSLEHTQPQDIIGQIAPEVVHTIISHPPGTFAVQMIDSSGGMSWASDSTRPPSVAQVKAIAFDDRLSTAEERSEAIERASMEWREQGLFAGVIGGRQWRNERYTVYVHPFRNAGLGGEVAFELERSACQLFGFVTVASCSILPITEYGSLADPGPKGTRSLILASWPGFLDNSVAGGIPVGMSPFESMVKECEEEASLTEDVARKHLKSVGEIFSPKLNMCTICFVLQRMTQRSYPSHWMEKSKVLRSVPVLSTCGRRNVPQSLKKSVQLMNWEAVIEKMKAGEFKRNSALVRAEPSYIFLLAQVGLARILDACWDIQGLLMSRRDRRKDRVLNYGTAPNPPLTTTTCATLNLWSVKMPPRRTKKPVKTKPSSPRSSELESEVPSKYFTSKIASKVKSIVGLETDDTKPVVNNKKRKRTNAATEHDREDEEPVPRQQLPRKPRTKASVPMTLTPQQLAAKQARISKATENDSESSESEDELATAPVSPTKPRPRGRPKRATAAPPKPKPKPASTRTRQSASTNTKVSSTSSARKTRKSRDEYDSSIRELTHSSNSPTPSETSDTRGSADYDPELEVSADYQQDEDEEEAALEAMEVDSDALDDESDFGPHRIAERASVSPRKKRTSTSSKASKGRKSVGKRAKKDATSEEEYQSDESGAIIVGKVVQAPETGRVPEGQISQNTFDFLLNLQDPEKNDREWFRLHEPVYRLAEKEWVAFVDAWVTTLVEVDDQIPPLPPKDIIHRIYRDVSPSLLPTADLLNQTSRQALLDPEGRGYLQRSMAQITSHNVRPVVKPGGGSLVAAGVWCPGKNELQTIRNVIQRNHARRLREIIAKPSFVKYFGAPEPLATKGKERQRQSIFGAEDELKVANGIDEMDCTLSRDIDLLKCRSFAVIHSHRRFTDAQVLKKDFLEKILKPVLVEVRPFVHWLPAYLAPAQALMRNNWSIQKRVPRFLRSPILDFS